MKHLLALTLLACGTCAIAGTPTIAATVAINKPGVYGRIDVGQMPAPPQVIYQQPMVIAPTPVAVYQRPVYLYVPEPHARDWKRHCGYYNACGQPVYFVHEHWVRERYDVYVHEHDHHDHGRGHDRHIDRDDHDDHDHDDHGHGHGRSR
jgi:hypothetical protein